MHLHAAPDRITVLILTVYIRVMGNCNRIRTEKYIILSPLRKKPDPIYIHENKSKGHTNKTTTTTTKSITVPFFLLRELLMS